MRAAILYLSRRYEDAIQAGQEGLGLKPNFSSAYEWIYRSQLHLRHVGEALAARAAMNASFVQLTPDSRFEEERRWMDAYRSGGLSKAVESLLAATASKPALDQHRCERATWKMWNADAEGALDELEHLFDFRPFNTIYTAVDPTFALTWAEAFSRPDFPNRPRQTAVIGIRRLAPGTLIIERTESARMRVQRKRNVAPDEADCSVSWLRLERILTCLAEN
jgi:hypothetical protein